MTTPLKLKDLKINFYSNLLIKKKNFYYNLEINSYKKQ
jgi:hypothetical protein